jgi:hypothetical protein
MKLLLLCAALCLPLAATADHADVDSRLDTLFGSHQPYEQFLGALKSAVAAKDWPAISLLLQYPISIKLGGHRVRIKTAAEFIGHIDAIFTPKVISAVEAQSYDTVFANANGVMIGDGEVWFSGICKDAQCKVSSIMISAINP